MSRPRDRASSKGLLPRMEARPLKNGGCTYRYHPMGGKPINLGRDKVAAIRKVLDLNGDSSDRGTVAELWRIYRELPDWAGLSEATRRDYEQCAGPLLKIFGKAPAAAIRPQHCNRYLRVERAGSPVRANREMALLSNLLNLAVNRGDIDANPCKQVRRNKEAPRTEAPAEAQLQGFLTWANAQGGQAVVLAAMAEFMSLAGARRVEFLRLTWPQVSETEVRMIRGKQRGDREVVDVVEITPALASVLDRMRALSPDPRIGTVFRSRNGNPYTDSGFKAVWNRLMLAAVAAGVVTTRFTFHDLRAYYATQHKAQLGRLPDLHANPATTARVYDRSTEAKRRAL